MQLHVHCSLPIPWETGVSSLPTCTHTHLFSPKIQLFVDKDTLVGAINAAHDTHTQIIDNKEDSISQRAKADRDALLERLSREEQLRNRQRVVEIEQYITHQHEELEGSDPHPH